MVPVRVAWGLIVALTGVACAATVSRLGGSWVASAVAGAAAVVFLSSPLVQGESANTETLMTLATASAAFFSVAAVRAVSDGGRPHGSRASGSSWAAGLCCGLAMLAKPTALPEAALFGIWIAVLSSRRILDLACFASGVAAPPLVVAVWLAASGALGPAFGAVVLYNFGYGVGSPVPVWARLAALPIEYGLSFALLWAAVGACALGTLRVNRRACDFSLAWTAAAIIGTIAGGRLYEHYDQQLVPPLAVALGVALASVLSHLRRPLARVALAAAIGAGFLPPLRAWSSMETVAAACDGWQTKLAALLRREVPASEPIFVWGAEPYLYFASGRGPVGRFIYKYPLDGDGDAARAAREELLAATASNPPAVVVILQGEQTAEVSADPNTDSSPPESLRPMLTDTSVVLRTQDFALLARPELASLPWSSDWQESRVAPRGCR